MLIALGENHRESGVTLKARVTWGAVNDSLCTVFSTPAIRGVKRHARWILWLKMALAVYGIP